MTIRASLITLGTCGAFAIACSASERNPFDPELETTFKQDAGVADAPVTRCVSETKQGEPLPISMVILLDRSGSMAGEKWTSATQAVRAFVDRSEVVGMKVGLQFFPPQAAGDQCSASLYKSLAVPIASLPDNVIPIQQKLLNSAADGGGTPMRSGLEGSIAAMRDFIEKGEPHAGAVILVTDGDPTACGSVGNVASVAAGGLTGTPVRTFTVGMDGASFGSLDQIATSGGTTKSFDVGAGPQAQSALVDALEKIRTGALGCEYKLPLPAPGQGVLDLNSVEVQFTPGANDPLVTIKKVDGKSLCGETTGGFYYDDPVKPTRVVLCPASCQGVRGATFTAKVDLHFGCIQRPN